jgi:hypothetical protein
MNINNQILRLVITDVVYRKLVLCRIEGYNRPLVLWRGQAYDVAGDYTQEDIENRVLELLGNDPAASLDALK